MHKSKKIAYILLFLVIIVTSFFILRFIIFNKIINKLSSKLENSYNLTLSIRDRHFIGVKSLLIEGISIKDSLNKTIFSSDTVFVQVRFWNILLGKVRFRKFHISNTKVTVSKKLFQNILYKKKTEFDSIEIKNIEKMNYAKTIDKAFNHLFSFVPSEIKIVSLIFNYIEDNKSNSLFCKIFRLENGKYDGLFTLNDSANKCAGKINGEINRSSKRITCSLKGCYNKPLNLYFTQLYYNTSLLFDSLKFSFNSNGINDDIYNFTGLVEGKNIKILNKKIGSSQISVNRGSLSFSSNVGPRYFEIDSTSFISINKFQFSPYIKFEKGQHRLITLKIPSITFDANSLFESLPDGIFNSIHNLKVKGKLNYSLDFFVDWDNPDSILLNSELNGLNFRIVNSGNSNLYELNDTFVHKIYDHDRFAKEILVSPENPDYVLLNNISPFLKYSVLTSEDGDFFYHKGFNEESLKNSITENIKQHRFARGGSTITMQLVKNIFLTRNKNFSRKLEEMFLVWLIENQHIISKERMLEIYFNIIEWGPGIYGVKDASNFYFNKRPSELTLSESIFLAAIIPCPKYFKYLFDDNKNLKSSYAWYYKQLPEMMLKRGQIQPADTFGLLPNVILQGNAIDFLIKKDTVQIDTTQFENHFLF